MTGDATFDKLTDLIIKHRLDVERRKGPPAMPDRLRITHPSKPDHLWIFEDTAQTEVFYVALMGWLRSIGVEE